SGQRTRPCAAPWPRWSARRGCRRPSPPRRARRRLWPAQRRSGCARPRASTTTSANGFCEGTTMRLFLIFCALLWIASCAEVRVEAYIVPPPVPPELRQPCDVQDRPYASLGDEALILTDHIAALDCANDRIVAVDTILTKAAAAASAQAK